MSRWRYAAATDTGLVRSSNQDALFVDDDLAIVADGMGGHAAGEVASAMTIEFVYQGFLRSPTVAGLRDAIEEANQAVLADASHNPEHFGMGTTVIAVGLTQDADGQRVPTMVHVGDSRCYQLRDGALRQLSDDHSVAEEWVRLGRLTPEEALEHPRRHQLTRAIGVEANVAVDVVSVVAMPGDRLLLCSDGLTNEVDPDTLARLASAPYGLDEAVENLVHAARAAGGRDNISVILIEFDDVQVSQFPIRETVATLPPPPPPRPNTSAGAHRRRRRWGWRVYAAGAAAAAIIAAFFVIMHWYAYSSYYLGNDAGTIAVYQGQPNGVLWYKPVKVLDTTYLVKDLRTADIVAVNNNVSEPSLEAALHYATYLHNAWSLANQTVVTTTTTSVPSVTTTTAKKG